MENILHRLSYFIFYGWLCFISVYLAFESEDVRVESSLIELLAVNWPIRPDKVYYSLAIYSLRLMLTLMMQLMTAFSLIRHVIVAEPTPAVIIGWFFAVVAIEFGHGVIDSLRHQLYYLVQMIHHQTIHRQTQSTIQPIVHPKRIKKEWNNIIEWETKKKNARKLQLM